MSQQKEDLCVYVYKSTFQTNKEEKKDNESGELSVLAVTDANLTVYKVGHQFLIQPG